MTDEPSLKPVIFIGSSRRDLREFPDPVQDHIGYALYVAQIGGKQRDTKTMRGFGGAGVVEISQSISGTHFGRCTPCDVPGRYMSFTPCRRNRKLE
jgi:phage-related protein